MRSSTQIDSPWAQFDMSLNMNTSIDPFRRIEGRVGNGHGTHRSLNTKLVDPDYSAGRFGSRFEFTFVSQLVLPKFSSVPSAVRHVFDSKFTRLLCVDDIGVPNRDLEKLDERLRDVKELHDGWDGEDAPRPSVDAIRRANNMLSWAVKNNIDVSSVDADVVGGVAVFVTGRSIYRDREVWFSVKNNGQDTVVASEFGRVSWHATLASDSILRAYSFLKG